MEAPIASQPLDVYRCPLDGIALIEASAGTGKTWAICGLVLRLLVEKNLGIDQVLVVTFTNAATAELRERVRARLVEVLAWLDGEGDSQDPFVAAFVASQEAAGLDRDTLRARLKAALTAFDEAAIFTIHGFCQRALGDSPFAAAQPFALELGDGAPLVREVVADYWRREIAHGNLPAPLLAWLVRRGFSPELLEELLARALKKPLATQLWPDRLDHLPPPDAGPLATARAAAAGLWPQARQQVADLLQDRLADLKYLDAAGIASGIQEWDAYFDASDPLAPIGDKAANFGQTTLAEKKTRKGKTPPEHPFFALADTLLAARAELDALLADHRLALLRDFLANAPDEVARRKAQRHQVDFDDLLQNLHKALAGPRGPALAAALRQRYPAALIDEFQDTDPLQFAIFQAIYGDGAQPVFLVGDPKQAIYSFRQADLHTYLAARDQATAHYHLDANQRSSAAVIAGINGLFSANPAAFMLAGLDFLPTRRGEKPLRDFTDSSGLARSPFQFWQLPDTDETLLTKPQALEAAAAACAGEIARLLEGARRGQVQLDGQPLQAGRIAILVRTHKQGRIVKAALGRVGLKAAELSQANVFASPEAEDLERLLAALLEPGRAPLLRAALATPLLGLDATAIAALDGTDPQAADADGLAAWTERFARWQQRWLARGIAVALGELGHALELPARLLALPDGERRLTNHLHLLELLHQAEADTPQPARLLRWFASQRRQPGADEAAQLRLESDRDLVGIVTIHKAKGLEYDLVFCPFLWEGGLQGRPGRLPGITYHDKDGRLVIDYRDGPELEAGKAAAALEQAAETLRLYYVALTRPVHRCYLVRGAYGKIHGSSGKPSRSESNKSLLNWLVAGAGREPADWLAKGGDPAAIDAAWQALAEGLEAGSAALPQAASVPVAAAPGQPDCRAAVPRRTPRPGWRIDSFTGLLRGAWLAPGESGGADHDALVPAASPVDADAAPVRPAPDDFLDFPRGARAGDCVHHLFEHVEFTDPASRPAAIAAALASQPPGAGPGDLAAMLARLLAQVLETPLPCPAGPPLRLDQISPRQRQAEMEFHLPVARLRPEALHDLLQAHGEPLPHLGFHALEGYLKGYMDLVFEHAGRYYVLDWKTNHLGWQAGDYGPAALDQAMLEHGYRLQARLYLLALHRHLARRLPDYDPARHLGGAYYLFVRGLRPDWQVDGQPAGVCHLPPKPELLAALDRLLQGAAP